MAVTKSELLAVLSDMGISAQTTDHAPLFTVAESKKLRGQLSGAHTKNLFLKDKKGQLYLIVAEESAQIDLKTLHKALGASGRFSFGKPDQMMQTLGVTPGSVTAFGVINDQENQVRCFIDNTLLESEFVNAHPLTNEATTTLASADLVKFMQAHGHEPTAVDLSYENA